MTEIRALFDEIATAFSALDMVRYKRIYQLPALIITPNSSISIRAEAELDAFITPMVEGLRARGYARSTYNDLSVHMFDDSRAIASMHWIRYKQDGSVLEELGATYIIVRTQEGWRLATLMAHAPGTVCKLT